jgi:hypothetical protein
MELAQDPGDALHLYKTILHRHPSLREALEGAGSAAFQLGRYLEAKHYLSHALEGPAVDKEPAAAIAKSRDSLSEATRLLALYPSSGLRPSERIARILTDRKLAMARLAECTQDRTAGPAKDSAQASSPAAKNSSALQNFASRFSRRPAQSVPNATATPAPVDPLAALTQKWQQLPVKISARDLEKDPELTQAQIQLIYDTELITQQVCGAPGGDDALLLRIAQAPSQVEEE